MTLAGLPAGIAPPIAVTAMAKLLAWEQRNPLTMPD
jgi:hypothetical protein